MTRFGLIADSIITFSKSTFVTGNVYAANFAHPAVDMIKEAVLDMQATYVGAAGRPDPVCIELGAGTIEGLAVISI